MREGRGGGKTHGAMTALAPGMGRVCPSTDAGTLSSHPSNSSESSASSDVYQDPAWSAARVPLSAIAPVGAQNETKEKIGVDGGEERSLVSRKKMNGRKSMTIGCRYAMGGGVG